MPVHLWNVKLLIQPETCCYPCVSLTTSQLLMIGMVPKCQNTETSKTPIQTYSVPAITADSFFILFFWLLGRFTTLPDFGLPGRSKSFKLVYFPSTLLKPRCHQTFFQDHLEKHRTVLCYLTSNTRRHAQRVSPKYLTALERWLCVTIVTLNTLFYRDLMA